MKSLRKNWVGVALLLATGTLLAQPAPSPVADEDAGTKPTAIKLTVEEMAAQIPEFLQQSVDDTRIVVSLQLKARKEKDVIKLACINDKFIQIKALQNIVDAAATAFQAEAPNLEAATPSFEAVRDNASGIRILREQAQICAGETEFRSDSDSGWEGPDIPDDPSEDIFDDEIEPPAYASPFN